MTVTQPPADPTAYSEDWPPQIEGQAPINIHGQEEDVAVYPDQTPEPLDDDPEGGEEA